MVHEKFKKLVFLYCECITEKDNPDFLELSEKDKEFCKEYINSSEEEIDFQDNTSLARGWIQQYSIKYCKRKLENGKNPFGFFEEGSIKIHVEEIDKYCIAQNNGKALNSFFKEIIIDLICLEYYSFRNMSVQISNQIEDYHALKDKKDDEKHSKQKEELSEFQKNIEHSIKIANKNYKKIANNID